MTEPYFWKKRSQQRQKGQSEWVQSEEEKELTYALRKQVAQKRNENGRRWTSDELINNCKETGGKTVLNSQENQGRFCPDYKKLTKEYRNPQIKTGIT